MARMLITGGAGFIGSNIAHAALDKGHDVVVLDDMSTGRVENLSDIAGKITLVRASILDTKKLAAAMRGADYVLHQAALASVPRSVKDPAATNQTNVTGTLNVLLAAKDAGVKRVVYASSSSVYGNLETLPKREDMKPCPESPYAVSKLAAEQYAMSFYSVYGLETVALRYFNVYGPKQDPDSQYAAVMPIFIRVMLAGRRPVIFGDGNQTRDFTFVEDVVEANFRATEASGAAGGVFNIAFGKRITLNNLVEKINGITGKNIAPVHEAERPGDVRHSLADIGAARKVLGYSPSHSVDDGLAKTIEWYRK